MVKVNQHVHHQHSHKESHSNLGLALSITLVFGVVEWITGVWSGSLALLSDAGHMFSDSVALGLAVFAQWVAKRPPSKSHTYGYARAEVIAALINSLLMVLLVVFIVVEAVKRFQQPQPILGGAVILVAAIGLVVNLSVIFIISRHQHSLNSRAALLHVLGDLLGSIAALLAGAVIYFTGWLPIDSILSMVVAALILVSSLGLIKQTLHILMEGVPLHLDLEQIGNELAKLEGVKAVHDLHVWDLASGKVALSAHLELSQLERWPELLNTAKLKLAERFHIEHVTLQPELVSGIDRYSKTNVPIFIRHSE